MRRDNIYFLGIGGIGMSALARYFRSQGHTVCGYDRTPGPVTGALIAEGIPVTFDDTTDSLLPPFADPSQRDRVMVVYTPAIPADNVLLNYFRDHGYEIHKRAEILGLLSRDTETIAVAGTHGKTSVSTLIAHLLRSSPLDCSAFLGGISKNYGTNLLLSESRFTVMEADEYDRSFLQLSPLITVVTAVEPDHLDIYGTAEAMVEAYSEFCSRTRQGGTLIIHEKAVSRLTLPGNTTLYTYGTGREASFRATDISKEHSGGGYLFNIVTPGEPVMGVRFHHPGMVNIHNVTAAVAAAWCAGADHDSIRSALASYEGVKRRFDIRYRGSRVIYIDDYAHHPGEIDALAAAVHDFWPGRRSTIIFQPHLYSRTRDFAEGFAKSLDKFDEVVLLTLYPAREKPLPGVSSDMIASLMTNRNVRVITREEMMNTAERVEEGLLLTVGAGDIDRFVEPIREMLEKRER